MSAEIPLGSSERHEAMVPSSPSQRLLVKPCSARIGAPFSKENADHMLPVRFE